MLLQRMHDQFLKSVRESRIRKDHQEREYLRVLAFTDVEIIKYQARILGIERRLWRYTRGYRHAMPYIGEHAIPPWPVKFKNPGVQRTIKMCI